MSQSMAPLDSDQVRKTTDALIDLAHYIPTLQSEASTFAKSGMVDDGERTLRLGRHVALKLTKALDELETMLGN